MSKKYDADIMNSKDKYKGDKDDDIKFFDVTIKSNENLPFTDAIYNIERDSNIINDCSKFYLSVLKFNISNFYVPIAVMPVAKTFYQYPNYNTEFINSDPRLLQYSVTLEYAGDIRLKYLLWDPAIIDTPPIPFINPITKNQIKSSYYWLFSYQWFLDRLDFALSDAFNDLTIKPPQIGVNPPLPPVFTYDPENSLFSFVCQKDYYDINTAPEIIKVYMNIKLWSIMGSFSRFDFAKENFNNDGRDIQLLPTNNYYKSVNVPNYSPPFTGDYIVLTQQFSTILNWNPFKRIIFKTNSIPTKPSLIGGKGDNTLQVLESFIPTPSNEKRTTWQYTPEFPGRLLNMTTTGSLRKIDLTIFWVDIYNNAYILSIPWNQELTTLLSFTNKEMFKNYYPNRNNK
jgi:hypothetical protein